MLFLSKGLKLKTILLLLIASLSIPSFTFADEWAKTYGGSNPDRALSIQQISDGYIVSGVIYSALTGNGDPWIFKLDSNGNILWQKAYHGTGNAPQNSIPSVQQTLDGGYIAAGLTNYFSVVQNEMLVFKIDANGNVGTDFPGTWLRTYGGSGNDEANSIRQTSDGGYIVAGLTDSFGAGQDDMWILKLYSNGDIQWQKTFGTGRADRAIQQTSDGGYVVAGLSSLAGVARNVWIVKLDNNGNIVWQKNYGGTLIDEANSIQQTSDGGYIVAGLTSSFGAGRNDMWILKLDSNGNILWQRTYGGTFDDQANSIQQTSDGGYIVAGLFGVSLTENDMWILKLNSSGNVLWQRTYGGIGNDRANSIQQTSDGGYIVAGTTYSFGAGSSDAWILKLDSNGNIWGCSSIGMSNAIVNTTAVTGGSASVTVGNTNVSPQTPAASVSNTNALVSQICYYTPTPPEPFDLISPLNGSLTTNPSPTFTWEPSSDLSGIVKYQLWIDDSLNQDNIPPSLTSATPASPLSLGPHTWYVKAFNGAGLTRDSTSTWTVTIVDSTPPAAFDLISPPHGSSTTNPLPTLTWSPSSDPESGIEKYQLWIDGSLNQDNIPPSLTSATPASPLSLGPHTWYVKAFNGDGLSTNSASTWTVRIYIPTTIPTGANTYMIAFLAISAISTGALLIKKFRLN